MPQYGTKARLKKLQADVGRLIEAQDTAASDGVELRRYADDPVGFIREVLGEEPFPAQERVAKSALEHPLTLVTAGVSHGKDWLAARLALWAALCRGATVLVFAPTQRQASTIIMSTEIANARRAAAINGHPLPGDLYANALRLPGQEAPAIRAVVSTSASKLTGIHSPAGVMVVATECQALPDHALEAAMSVTVGHHDRILAVGNPLAEAEPWVFDAVKDGSPWNYIPLGAEDHPNIAGNLSPSDPGFVAGGPTTAFVQRMRDLYGEDAPEFVSRVLGKFPGRRASGEALFERAWLDAAIDRHARVASYLENRLPPDRSTSGGWPSPGNLTFGVDVARGGRTVVCVVSGAMVIAFHSWQGVTIPEGVDRLVSLLRGYRLDSESAGYSLRIDNTGIGPGFTDILAERGWQFTPVHFGAKAPRGPMGEQFLNMRAYLYWSLALRFRRGLLSVPGGNWTEELLATNWITHEEFSGGQRSQHLQLEEKRRIARRLGRSPDAADALALAVSPMHAATGSVSFYGVTI